MKRLVKDLEAESASNCQQTNIDLDNKMLRCTSSLLVNFDRFSGLPGIGQLTTVEVLRYSRWCRKMKLDIGKGIELNHHLSWL